VIPSPHLDDRRFQDLVDEAKRAVARRCPEWTDHNVSDPGVTLIELFADMTDQLLFRLNRVPDKHYLAFLDLLGVRLFPPVAATAPVTFWLSAPRPDPVLVPGGTQVATSRATGTAPIGFTTVEELSIVPCRLQHLRAARAGESRSVDHTADLRRGTDLAAFSARPVDGEALLVGLDVAAPGCAVALRIDCRIDGIGVDPTRPPLRWEAHTPSGWAECDVEFDETGGLNRAGDVVLHLPREHTTALVDDVLAGWLRAVVVPSEAGQPAYSRTPTLRGLSAMTVGGTARAAHAEVVAHEVLGTAEGVPGQRLRTRAAPLVHDTEPLVLEVSGAEWTPWTEVSDLASAGPDDRVFTVDRVHGEIQLGPAVREPDGSIRHHGAVPPAGAQLRLIQHRVGGGARGNVAAHALVVLRSSLPFVSRVDNRRPAQGGRDGEDLENARGRGPFLLRSRDRAVTTEDFRLLAQEAAPEAGRIHCVPASQDDGTVRVLVVPALGPEAPRFEELLPEPATLERIATALEERRLIGTRVSVEPPRYQGVTVVARLRSRPGPRAEAVRQAALDALGRHLHPMHWPFGRPVHVGEVYALLSQLPDVDLVEDIRLFRADPTTDERSEEPQRVEVAPHALVFGYRHQVLVERSRFL
jgi:predicted phage baseplate assembly protein